MSGVSIIRLSEELHVVYYATHFGYLAPDSSLFGVEFRLSEDSFHLTLISRVLGYWISDLDPSCTARRNAHLIAWHTQRHRRGKGAPYMAIAVWCALSEFARKSASSSALAVVPPLLNGAEGHRLMWKYVYLYDLFKFINCTDSCP